MSPTDHRWLSSLAVFDFDISYYCCKANRDANRLSRQPDNEQARIFKEPSDGLRTNAKTPAGRLICVVGALLPSERWVMKKEVFETIAKQFNEEADVLVDGTQCMRKWSKLETQFKKIEDNNKQTGRANKSWKFYNHLEQCIGDSPRVHPAYTFDTAMPSTSSASSSTDSEKSSVVHSDSNGTDDDECDVDDSMAKGKKPKTLKKRQRKRKSHSSASEMLAFLESYTAKREKVEEEKLQLMRETQQKKDNFFTQFLDILKNK
ncbi:hypothetical protein ACROYT_G015930 [Oculina patagonica]